MRIIKNMVQPKQIRWIRNWKC